MIFVIPRRFTTRLKLNSGKDKNTKRRNAKVTKYKKTEQKYDKISDRPIPIYRFEKIIKYHIGIGNYEI